MNISKGSIVISTDPGRLDLDATYAYLSRSYWAKARPKEVVALSLQHSLCFGVYDGEQQIGLARVVTDYATFAYLADVYILEPYRGQGLGKWLISVVLSYPELQGVGWHLRTQDAHGLYREFGFTELAAPERHMERRSAAPLR